MQDLQINRSAVKVGECLTNASALIQPNYLVYVGMVVVFFIGLFIIALIPYIGQFINLFLTYPVLCGIYGALFAEERNEPVDFSMMFDGFSKFGSCVLLNLYLILPFLLLIPLMLGLGMAGSVFNSPGGPRDSVSPQFSGIFILAALIFYLLFFLFYLTTFFSLQLIADRNVGIVEAISLSTKAFAANWGGIILVSLLQGLLTIAGALLFCIGLFFVMPLVYGMSIAAYRMVFPATEPAGFQSPPSPSEYGGMFGSGR